MNWILGIDTSSVDLGIGLFHNSEPVACYSRFIRNSHAEHIAHAVEMLLKMNNVDSKEINHVAVSIGPGSFTGLRIGISFVKGFCFARNIAILPVSSLEILANMARNHQGRIISAIDARNDNVFVGTFEAKNGNLCRLNDDIVVNISSFKDLLSKTDTIVTDTMGYSRSTAFNFLCDFPKVMPVEHFPAQRGLICSLIGAQSLAFPDLWKDEMSIVPNYLRASAAQKLSKVLSNE